MSKLPKIVAAIIAVLWIVKNPAGAASDVHQLLTALTTFASRI